MQQKWTRPKLKTMHMLSSRFHLLYIRYRFFAFGVGWRILRRRYDFCHFMEVMSLGATPYLWLRRTPQLFDANEIPNLFERQGRHFVEAENDVKQLLMKRIRRDTRNITNI